MPHNPLREVVERSRRLRDNTKNNYLQSIDSFISYAGTNPKNWRGATVEGWLESLRKKGLTPNSLNTHLSSLQASVKRWVTFEGPPATDFAAGVEPFFVPERKTRRSLTTEEVNSLLSTCENDPHGLRDYALITLAVRTGLRREGIQKLNFEDIKQPRLHVILKGGKKHSFVADRVVFDALRPWIKFLMSNGIKSGAVFRGMREGQEIGNRLDLASINRLVSNRARKANLRNVHPHLFRHTFISWARTAGVPDWRIAEVTGHTVTNSGVPMLQTYTTDVNAEKDPVGGYLPKPER